MACVSQTTVESSIVVVLGDASRTHFGVARYCGLVVVHPMATFIVVELAIYHLRACVSHSTVHRQVIEAWEEAVRNAPRLSEWQACICI